MSDGSAAVAIPAAKQRIVLAALLLRAGRVVSVNELADFVWDGAPIAGARGALLNHVMRLRQALGDDARQLIRTQGAGYLVDIEGHTLDLQLFRGRLELGRAAADSRQWQDASKDLRRALALWRGEFLADVPSAALLLSEGPALAEARLSAVQTRIEADMQLGHHETVIGELRQLVSSHPLRERLHEHLMLALYRSGRQAEALAAYRAVHRLLVDELGVEPGEALRRLHQAILDGDPDLDPASSPKSPRMTVSGPAQRIVPAQVPSGIADFTGRRTHLDTLHYLLSAAPDSTSTNTVVLATLGGTGGIGKTTLAVRAAHQLSAQFPDGQLYVNLRGAREAPLNSFEVVGRFLRDLGVAPAAVPLTMEERVALYRTVAADRRLLIVLDDARDAEQVRPLVPGRGSCCVLITSRNSLSDLAGAAHMNVDCLSPRDAQTLFERIVGSGRIAAETGATGEVLAACAGLPLAIRIAASRLVSRPNWTIRHLADRLADQAHRLDELQVGDLAVRVSFRVSYAALSTHGHSAAARAFRLLGLVTGSSIERSAAAALMDAPPEEADAALEALVDAHLLESPEPGRYRLHDLLRVYAGEIVEEEEPSPSRQQAVRRLLEWYLHSTLAAAAALAPQRRRVDPGPWHQSNLPHEFATYDQALDWCESERANLIAASRQAADLGFHDIAWKLPGTLQRLFNIRKYWSDWVSTHELAVRSAQTLADPFGESWIRSNLGLAHLELGQYDRALSLLQEALRIRRRIQDRSGEGATVGSIALAYARQGRHAEAVDYYQQSVAIHAELGDRYNESIELNNLGDTFRSLGSFHDAIACANRALALSRAVDDPYVEGLALSTLGETYRDRGDVTEAIRHAEQSVVLFREIRHRQLEAAVLYWLSHLYFRCGRLDAAHRGWSRTRQIFEEMNDPRAVDVTNHLDIMQLADEPCY
ncbi:BTAD domain-containing putative transcriptional regulator [Streptomyces sp. NPDC002746]